VVVPTALPRHDLSSTCLERIFRGVSGQLGMYGGDGSGEGRGLVVERFRSVGSGLVLNVSVIDICVFVGQTDSLKQFTRGDGRIRSF
jgi:hypothetical protein